MKSTHPGRSARRAVAGRYMHRKIALAAIGLLALTTVTPAQAATEVTVKNPGGIVAVGPVNTDFGFPSWYQDSAAHASNCASMRRIRSAGSFPATSQTKISPFPSPRISPRKPSTCSLPPRLDLPGGGRAVLVLGVEAAFANQVQAGDQVVFGRQRVTVRGATPNATLTFRHPYGTMTIDTDAAGAGKLVEDISPAAGNFTTALKSNIGPFLRWDPATAPAAPSGYLGDPGQEHKVTGSPFGYNKFSVSGGGLNVSTDLFSLQGKISTNTGVETQRALLAGDMIDVFATSEGYATANRRASGQVQDNPDGNRPGIQAVLRTHQVHRCRAHTKSRSATSETNRSAARSSTFPSHMESPCWKPTTTARP